SGAPLAGAAASRLDRLGSCRAGLGWVGHCWLGLAPLPASALGAIRPPSPALLCRPRPPSRFRYGRSFHGIRARVCDAVGAGLALAGLCAGGGKAKRWWRSRRRNAENVLGVRLSRPRASSLAYNWW